MILSTIVNLFKTKTNKTNKNKTNNNKTKYRKKTQKKSKKAKNQKTLSNKQVFSNKKTPKNQKRKTKQQKGGDGFTTRTGEIIGGMPVYQRYNESGGPVSNHNKGFTYGKTCGKMTGGGYSQTHSNAVLNTIGHTPYDDGYQPILKNNKLVFKQ
jgi:hypothetical protein